MPAEQGDLAPAERHDDRNASLVKLLYALAHHLAGEFQFNLLRAQHEFPKNDPATMRYELIVEFYHLTAEGKIPTPVLHWILNGYVVMPDDTQCDEAHKAQQPVVLSGWLPHVRPKPKSRV